VHTKRLLFVSAIMFRADGAVRVHRLSPASGAQSVRHPQIATSPRPLEIYREEPFGSVRIAALALASTAAVVALD